ncbi:hypothetical protein [Thauera sp. Sel9]|uniref:hypothetical protein n=1 Tax=Thauera sp. Sel9 TaxID=2974299 RepID=UPI0021E112CB|nr:hypothetical protein [Thauera sp. Sel9]MCV2216076.1 hypothetical protein [Thauera sp. Sel9]
MPHYSFSVLERIYHVTGGVGIEADSLEEAMAILADNFHKGDSRWDMCLQEMAILSITKDGDEILEDPGNQSLWPDEVVAEGRVWDKQEDGPYPLDELPPAIQTLIDEEA